MVAATTFVSCNDDDGPSIAYDFAEITGNNLPAYFEVDEDYDITVSYELPDACHNFFGFNGGYQLDSEDESILVYEVLVQTSYDPNITECTEDDTDLVQTRTLLEDFNLSEHPSFDDDIQTIRFKFVTGVNTSENEYVFTTVDVPVGAPEEDGSGDEDDTDDTENNGEAGNA